MKHKAPAWLILMLIAASAGLMLSVTNALTAPAIERQSIAAADASRIAVFPEADAFRAVPLAENAAVDACYEALSRDAVIGHVGTATVKGYGGEIEITIGLDANSVITGISVGGDNFSESPGLGARTRDAAFTSQFLARSAPVTLGKDVDSVTGASISSGAVVSGVNKIVKYIENIGKDASETDLYHNAVGENDIELANDGTVDRAYRTENGGFTVFATAKGFHGDVHIVVLLDATGTITRVAIDETDFNETAGLGERVLEEGFLRQFNGLSGIIGVLPGGYGAGDADATSAATAEATESTDATSSATAEATESTDATSAATAEATEGTDATSAATAEATESADATSSATAEATEGADATSAATAEATESTDATSAATAEATEGADATSSATAEATEGTDATSSASIVIEKIEGANAEVDGVSGATYSSAAVAKAVNAALAFIQRYLGTAA